MEALGSIEPQNSEDCMRFWQRVVDIFDLDVAAEAGHSVNVAKGSGGTSGVGESDGVWLRRLSHVAGQHFFAESINGSCWNTCKRRLVKLGPEVLMVVAQEVRLFDEGINEAHCWLAANGWQGLFLPAEHGEGGGASAGVAILVRSCVGLAAPPGGQEVVPHRILAGLVQVPGDVAFIMYAGYFQDGIGCTGENLRMLGKFGEHAEAMTNLHGWEWCIGADFNFTPGELDDSGVIGLLGGHIIASPVDWPTCVMRGSSRVLDYWAASGSLGRGSAGVRTMMEPGMSPHRPSRLGFAPNLGSAQYLTLRLPPKLPATEVVGPGWEADFRKADRLCARVKELAKGKDRKRAADVLEFAFREFASRAEEELIPATGMTNKRKGFLGCKPSFVWADVIPKAPKAEKHYLSSKQQEDAERWQWLVMRGRELRTLATRCFSSGTGQADHQELLNFVTVADMGIIPSEGEWTAAEAGNELDRHWRGAATIVRRQMEGTIRKASLADTLRCRGRGTGGLDDDDEEQEEVVAREVADWMLMFDESANDWSEALSAAQSIASKQANGGWEDWVESALQRGCKAAHRWAKAPVEKKPDKIVYIDGMAFSDPMKLLEEECERLCVIWEAEDAPLEDEVWELSQLNAEDVPSLGGPSADEVYSASRLFPQCTAVSFDGFHPRNFSMLSVRGRTSFGHFCGAMEAVGALPRSLDLTQYKFIPKPKGGRRGIAIYPGPYRVWSRIRAPLCRQWEDAHPATFFAARKGMAAQDTVWAQEATAEAAKADGFVASAALMDMDKYYERFNHGLMIARARRLGFPLAVARIAINTYRGRRVFSANNFVLRQAWARRSMGAGCVFATTWVKVYTFEPTSEWCERWPWLTIDTYLDDVVISDCCRARSAIGRLAPGVQDFVKLAMGELEAMVAPDKGGIVSSSERVAKGLRRKLGWKDVGEVEAANLGIGFSSGRGRSAPGTGRIRRARFSKGRKRGARGRRLIGAAKGDAKAKAAAVFTMGVGPESVYGASVTGLADGELLSYWRSLMAGYAPFGPSASIWLKLLTHGVPGWQACVAPALQFHRMIESAVRDGRYARVPIRKLRGVWRRAAAKAKDTWRHSRGPVNSAILSLRRIGWEVAEDPFWWTNDFGEAINVSTISGQVLHRFLHEAVTRAVERKASRTLRGEAAKGLPATEDLGEESGDGEVGAAVVDSPLAQAWASGRVFGGHLASTFRTKSTWATRKKHWCAAYSCGTCWTKDIVKERGYPVESVLCDLCGKAEDSTRHRLIECEAVQGERDEVGLSWLGRFAETEESYDIRILRGWVPHPGPMVQRPAGDCEPTVEYFGEHDPSGTMGGHVFWDGSCTCEAIPELNRAAWSAVQVDNEGFMTARMRGPVPFGLPQTPQAAEHVGAVYTLANTRLGSMCYGDCRNVTKCCEDLKAGKEVRGAYRQLYGKLQRSDAEVPDSMWIKAHRTLDDDADEVEKLHIRGNGEADREAKKAVEDLQPAVTRQFAEDAKVRVARAKGLLRLAYALWPLWPKPKKEAKMKAAKAETARKEVADRVHDMAIIPGRAPVCRHCWRHCDVPTGLCSGPPRFAKPLIAAGGLGHSVCTFDAASGDRVIVCLLCGFWAENRLVGLGQPCRRRARGAGRDALLRIRRGLHPRRKEHIFGGERILHFIDEAVGAAKSVARSKPEATSDGRRSAPWSKEAELAPAQRRALSQPAGRPAGPAPDTEPTEQERRRIDRSRAEAEVKRRLKEEEALQRDRLGSWAPPPGRSCLRSASTGAGVGAVRRSLSWGEAGPAIGIESFRPMKELWWSTQDLGRMREQRRRCGSKDASRDAKAKPGGDSDGRSVMDRARPDGFQRGGDLEDPLTGRAASERRAAMVDALLPLPPSEVRWVRVAPPTSQPERRRTRPFQY